MRSGIALAAFSLLAASQEPTVIRTTTRVVELNVVVTDQKGEVVSGLTRDDFTILEGNRRQTISHFSVEDLRTLPPPPEPLPADVFTNRLDMKGGVPSSVTVILWDVLNTQMLDRLYARQQVAHFLRSELDANDRIALYCLGARLMMAHDFTNDSSQLLRTLERASRQGSAVLDGAETTESRAMNETLRSMEQEIADQYTASRVKITADALKAIADRLAGLPGRKNLVWISGGLPASAGLYRKGQSASDKRYKANPVQFFQDDIDRAGHALQAANVAIYPINARGLASDPGYHARARVSSRMAMVRQEGPAQIMPEDYYTTRESMQALAGQTGGRAALDTNDMSGAIRRAVSDGRLSYTLAYTPDHNQWDGHYQKIAVKLARTGLTVRCRNGYIAWPDRAPAEDEQYRAFVVAATSPLEATGVRIQAAVRQDRPAKGDLSLRFLAETSDIRLRKQDGRWTGKLFVGYVQQTAATPPKTSVAQETISINMNDEELTTARAQGIAVEKAIRLSAGTALVKVIVQDSANGAIGSVFIPVNQH